MSSHSTDHYAAALNQPIALNQQGDPAGDPSMRDILSSIRRIMDDDDSLAGQSGPSPEEEPVLLLDDAMRVEPAPESGFLLDPSAARRAATAMAQLAQQAGEENPPPPATLLRQGGPSLEDITAGLLRPLIKEWLDAHLPPMVEALVRAEIARIGPRRA